MIHDLKTWPEFFTAITSGIKPFEVRKDDRGFEVGDTLRLREWQPGVGYTGAETTRVVTYILVGGFFGLEHGAVVMGLAEGGEHCHCLINNTPCDCWYDEPSAVRGADVPTSEPPAENREEICWTRIPAAFGETSDRVCIRSLPCPDHGVTAGNGAVIGNLPNPIVRSAGTSPTTERSEGPAKLPANSPRAAATAAHEFVFDCICHMSDEDIGMCMCDLDPGCAVCTFHFLRSSAGGHTRRPPEAT